MPLTLPEKPIDGRSILPLLLGDGSAACPHQVFWIYYQKNELQAVIAGNYKLILPHRYRTLDGRLGGTGGQPVAYHPRDAGTELYDLAADPGETRDLAAAMPDKVAELMAHVEAARAELGDAITGRRGRGSRSPGLLTAEEHAALMRVHWPEGRRVP
jgi:arylsulfatase A